MAIITYLSHNLVGRSRYIIFILYVFGENLTKNMLRITMLPEAFVHEHAHALPTC
jgi:hypothetical protein